MDKALYKQGKRLLREKIADYAAGAARGDCSAAKYFLQWEQFRNLIDNKKLDVESVSWAFVTLAGEIDSSDYVVNTLPPEEASAFFLAQAADHATTPQKFRQEFQEILEENKDLLLFLRELLKEQLLPAQPKTLTLPVNGKPKVFTLWGDDAAGCV